MEGPPVIRLFRCRPLRGAFDRILRDVLAPAIEARPGALAVFVGRQGPDELGERLIASIWTSAELMAESMGTDADDALIHPEFLPDTTDRRLAVLPVSLQIHSAQAEPTLIRLARGSVRAGRLAQYGEQVRIGVEADIKAGHGPISLYFATMPGAGFSTLSLWRSWDDVAVSTGAGMEAPIATRYTDDLTGFAAEFFEVVPGVPMTRHDVG